MVVQKASKPAFDRQQSYKVESRLTGGAFIVAPLWRTLTLGTSCLSIVPWKSLGIGGNGRRK